MPAPRSSSSGRSGKSGGRKSQAGSGTGAKRSGAGTAKRRSASGSRAGGSARGSGASSRTKSTPARSAASKTSAPAPKIGDQLANGLIKPLDLVLISRERIQQTLDEAAERGRVTRGDANELVLELIKRGRQQTDDLLNEIERLLGRGRDQLESAGRRVRTTEPVDRLVRGADRARRTVGVGPSFPILGYDDLTAAQVDRRLSGLKPADLRKVRDYERRHANRKSVLDAIERALA